MTAAHLWEDPHFTLDLCQDCPLPGYLILTCKPAQASLASVSEAHAGFLGHTLSNACRAIEKVVGAERVYILSFCEVNHALHFHLFPRTAWLGDLYSRDMQCEGQPLDGPQLVVWAREKARRGGIPIPSNQPDIATAATAICNHLSATP